MAQKIYFRENIRERLSEIIRERGIEKLLLVCGGSFDALPLSWDILSLDAGIVRFGGFSPIPRMRTSARGWSFSAARAAARSWPSAAAAPSTRPSA